VVGQGQQCQQMVGAHHRPCCGALQRQQPRSASGCRDGPRIVAVPLVCSPQVGADHCPRLPLCPCGGYEWSSNRSVAVSRSSPTAITASSKNSALSSGRLRCAELFPSREDWSVLGARSVYGVRPVAWVWCSVVSIVVRWPDRSWLSSMWCGNDGCGLANRESGGGRSRLHCVGRCCT
jgi:hypothetical protein